MLEPEECGQALRRERGEHAGPPQEWTETCIILVASDLDDKGLLQEPQLFFTEVNTHTHLIPGVRENEEKPNGEKRETEGPAVASHQGMNQQNTVIVEAPQYGKS